MYGQYQTDVTSVRDGDNALVRVTEDRKLIVSVEETAPAVAATTWTHTAVTLTGSSQTVAAANASRVGLIIQNRTGNSAFAIDISGGTATLVGGLAVSAGANIQLLGATAPANAVTGIGTGTEIVDVWEGVAA